MAVERILPSSNFDIRMLLIRQLSRSRQIRHGAFMDELQGHDDSLCIKDACKQFQKPVPRTTLSGWISNGVLNRFTKERIYLESNNQGGSVLISRASISLFLRRLNSRVPTNDDGTPKGES